MPRPSSPARVDKDEVDWNPAGDVIRLIPHEGPQTRDAAATIDGKLEVFDQATARQGRRNQKRRERPTQRGWKREDLYDRGRTR